MPLLIRVWSKFIGKFEKIFRLILSPIEKIIRENKIKTIHAAYERLNQKDGEIQTNLKLMDVSLADLIMPINDRRKSDGNTIIDDCGKCFNRRSVKRMSGEFFV